MFLQLASSPTSVAISSARRPFSSTRLLVSSASSFSMVIKKIIYGYFR
jgi:hypothetical protein